MGFLRRGLALVAASVGLLWVATAAAQADDPARSAARTLGTAGVESYEAGNYAEAHTNLEKAYAVLRAPTLGLWSARALVKVGKLVQAAERYLEVAGLQVPVGDADLQAQARKDAQAELDLLRPKIPRVVIQVEGAERSDIEVTLDGKPLATAVLGEARLVDPGPHRAEGRRGSEKVEAEATLREGEQQTLVLRFGAGTGTRSASPAEGVGTPAAAPDASPDSGSLRKPLAWVAIGLGAAGLAIGTGTGVMAMSKRKEMDQSPYCRDGKCLPEEEKLVQSLNSFRTASTIGFVAGGALAAIGITLLVTAPSTQKPSVALRISPVSTDLVGRF